MHICTYFCVSGPFGTHPPLAVQKYTWYFCGIGKNMDTHPQNGTFVQKMHGTFVFSGQSGPPPPKIFTKILPKKFDKKLKKNPRKKLKKSKKIHEKFNIFDKKIDFSWIFREICVQKYLYTFVFWVSLRDTTPLLYKSTHYTFVFWVPSGPTPPHTRPVLLCWPPPGSLPFRIPAAKSSSIPRSVTCST